MNLRLLFTGVGSIYALVALGFMSLSVVADNRRWRRLQEIKPATYRLQLKITVTVLSIDGSALAAELKDGPKIASVVIPGLRYHLAQRGNSGRKMFFTVSDYAPYGDRLSEAAREAGVAVWA